MNVRVVLDLTADEADKLLALSYRSDRAGVQSPSMRSLAEKIRAAVDAAEVEADEPVYTHDVGGES